ncbi:MAG: bifunctional 4-hydroxy-2-oxoglutarate aldolase/2-dehydro-3-deoxy-phosphogluconate aldolase [Armatimonadota bacterium]
MAQFSRMETLNAMYDAGLVPVFYQGDIDVAKKIVDACSAGSARVLEFTNRGDFAPDVFGQLVKYCMAEHPEMIMGVGSVIDAPTAAQYLANGANFIVGPTMNEEAAKVCNIRKVPYSPGCGSANEIQKAHELGCEIVKVFPGGLVGGPKFISSLKGPCPWVSLMPTGGVDITWESVSSWIEGGAAALGIGSKLIRKDLVAAGDFDQIRDNVARTLWYIKKARGESVFRGVEHPGLYPEEDGQGEEVARWYADTFGFEMNVGNSSVFVAGEGPGRLEIAKDATHDKAHVAILVADFDAAAEELKEKGFEFEEISEKPGLKAGYLTETDPAGHRVHLLWNPSVMNT